MRMKCKMCGGELPYQEQATVVECLFCGSWQTVTTTNDKRLRETFERANAFRRKNEFDRAAEEYKKVLEQTDDAEAYWGSILCKYGIEYVKDPKTGRMIPTCHRTLCESILSDVDYLAALEHADAKQKTLFENEAVEISRLQAEILQIARKEDPYDVFICFKDTDDRGDRTTDSLLAEKIYEQLTREGYRVFFSRISLENKLGKDYEPHIFAALTSAKVMVVVGTSQEYFNAVWVKNEWSRYLKLLNKDRLLIPCFRDMDPKNLPKEFGSLEALDMSKIGFVRILIQNIEAIVGGKAQKASANAGSGVRTGINPKVDPLLRRANIFLQDEEWDKVVLYSEKVLDIDPECADAYLLLLLSKYHAKSLKSLRANPQKILTEPEYQKTQRFASKQMKEELAEKTRELEYLRLLETVRERSREQDIEGIRALKKELLQLNGYADSAVQAEKCDSIEETIIQQLVDEGFALLFDEGAYINEEAGALFKKALQANPNCFGALVGYACSCGDSEEEGFKKIKEISAEITKFEKDLLQKDEIFTLYYFRRVLAQKHDQRVRYMIDTYPEFMTNKNLELHTDEGIYYDNLLYQTIVRFEDRKYVQWMLDAGASPFVYNVFVSARNNAEDWFPAAEDCIQKENIEMLQLLLKYGYSTDDSIVIQKKDGKGQEFPLLYHTIVNAENMKMAKFLLENGAKPDAKAVINGKPQKTVLMVALLNNLNSSFVEMLLKHGASYDAEFEAGSIMNGIKNTYHTPLSLSIVQKKEAEVNMLLKQKPDLKQKIRFISPNKQNCTATPLGFAMLCAIYDEEDPARLRIIKKLLAHGASMNDELSFDSEVKPIIKFPFKKKTVCSAEFIKLLKEHGWKSGWF